MLEVADIFRLHGPDYRTHFANRMLPSHLRAMQDIEQCRTASLGGQLYYCAQCDQQRYSFIPARIATAPSAKTSRPMNGSKSKRICCFPLITSWSPSPCPQSCAPSRVPIKR
jgi:hypothetical protein